MGQLDTIYTITEQLELALDRLDEPGLDRDTLIQEVTNLIDQRDKIIVQLHQPYSEKEIEIGRKIIQMNERIKKQMDILYGCIKKDMKQVRKKKTQNYSYLHPYGNLKTSDGMYLDNKL